MQGTLDLAERLRDDGIARALDHAAATTPSWKDVATGYVMLFANRKTDFMIEDARLYAEGRGFALPPDRRAWGGIAVKLSRKGIIRGVGYAPNKDPGSHCSPKTVWRGA